MRVSTPRSIGRNHGHLEDMSDKERANGVSLRPRPPPRPFPPQASDVTCTTIDRSRWNVTLNYAVSTGNCPIACPQPTSGAYYSYACVGTTPSTSGIGLYGVGTSRSESYRRSRSRSWGSCPDPAPRPPLRSSAPSSRPPCAGNPRVRGRASSCTHQAHLIAARYTPVLEGRSRLREQRLGIGGDEKSLRAVVDGAKVEPRRQVEACAGGARREER